MKNTKEIASIDAERLNSTVSLLKNIVKLDRSQSIVLSFSEKDGCIAMQIQSEATIQCIEIELKATCWVNKTIRCNAVSFINSLKKQEKVKFANATLLVDSQALYLAIDNNIIDVGSYTTQDTFNKLTEQTLLSQFPLFTIQDSYKPALAVLNNADTENASCCISINDRISVLGFNDNQVISYQYDVQQLHPQIVSERKNIQLKKAQLVALEKISNYISNRNPLMPIKFYKGTKDSIIEIANVKIGTDIDYKAIDTPDHLNFTNGKKALHIINDSLSSKKYPYNFYVSKTQFGYMLKTSINLHKELAGRCLNINNNELSINLKTRSLARTKPIPIRNTKKNDFQCDINATHLLSIIKAMQNDETLRISMKDADSGLWISSIESKDACQSYAWVSNEMSSLQSVNEGEAISSINSDIDISEMQDPIETGYAMYETMVESEAEEQAQKDYNEGEYKGSGSNLEQIPVKV